MMKLNLAQLRTIEAQKREVVCADVVEKLTGKFKDDGLEMLCHGEELSAFIDHYAERHGFIQQRSFAKIGYFCARLGKPFFDLSDVKSIVGTDAREGEKFDEITRLFD